MTPIQKRPLDYRNPLSTMRSPYDVAMRTGYLHTVPRLAKLLDRYSTPSNNAAFRALKSVTCLPPGARPSIQRAPPFPALFSSLTAPPLGVRGRASSSAADGSTSSSPPPPCPSQLACARDGAWQRHSPGFYSTAPEAHACCARRVGALSRSSRSIVRHLAFAVCRVRRLRPALRLLMHHLSPRAAPVATPSRP